MSFKVGDKVKLAGHGHWQMHTFTVASVAEQLVTNLGVYPIPFYWPLTSLILVSSSPTKKPQRARWQVPKSAKGASK